MENILEANHVSKSYMKMAMPVVLGMVVTLVYNMVDTYFIALTGNTNLIAGVSVCTPLFTLLIAIGDIFGLGGSSVIARLLGEGDDEAVKHKSAYCIYMTVIVGIIFSAIMLIFRGPILGLLGASAQTMEYASGYYTWLMTGATFVIISIVPSNLLRTEGAALPAMFGQIFGAVVNIILDPIFIFVLGFGAAGAAMATVIGYIFSFGYFVVYIIRHHMKTSVNPRDFVFDRHTTAQVLMIGLPAAVNNLMQTVGITITNRAMLVYGDEKIAVMGIVLKVVNIALLILIGLAFGGQPLLGYNYGARRLDKMKEIMRFGIKVTAGSGIVLTVLLSLLAHPIISVFLKDPALIALGVRMLRYQLAGMTLMGFCLIFITAFQATGKGLAALIMSLCRQGIVYAPLLFLGSMLFGLTGAIAAQAAADVVTTFVALFLYRTQLYGELHQ